MSGAESLFSLIRSRCRPGLAPILTFCLVFMASANSYAATLFGTVRNDSGPVTGASVFANGNQIATTDSTGHFSVDIADGFYKVSAEFVSGGSHQYNFPVGVDVSQEREVRLYIKQEVTISGSVEVPAEYSNNWIVRASSLDEIHVRPANITGGSSFEVTLLAGKYALAAMAGFFFDEDLVFVSGEGAFYSSVAVDASNGSVHDVLIPEVPINGPVYRRDPPVASRVQVGGPDENGIATCTGSAGAADGLASLLIRNLQTGQYNIGASNSDGSFAVSLFAPTGSSIAIYQDPTGEMNWHSLRPHGAGTIIRIPVPNEAAGGFATGAKLAVNGEFDINAVARIMQKDLNPSEIWA